jgi:regulator of replication initiation timing
MLTAENIALFIGSVVAALAVAIIYNRLHVGSMDYRESRIEDEVKQLRQRVEALQTTIDLMSNRIFELQKENERLKNELTRLVPFGSWQATESMTLRKALERLTEDEFASLAYDSFRAIYDGFTAEQSLNRRRQALIEYAEKQGKMDLLRAAILTINPAAFG